MEPRSLELQVDSLPAEPQGRSRTSRSCWPIIYGQVKTTKDDLSFCLEQLGEWWTPLLRQRSEDQLTFFREKCLRAQVLQTCPTLWDPTDCRLRASLSMEFFRQESWSELPFPSPGDLSIPGFEPEPPAKREWLPTPVFWPGEFHGQRRLAGYSPWGHKESDSTERL